MLPIPANRCRYFRRGNGYLSEQAAARIAHPGRASRGPLSRRFANIYMGAISDMKKKDDGEHLDLNYPTVVDGLRGMGLYRNSD